jgi:hypothetical protein
MNSVSECFLLKPSEMTLITVSGYELTKNSEEDENPSRK